MYEPLAGPLEIRLLVLQPGSEDVHFVLRHANLEGRPDYEAISYCWGDPTDTRTVYCDDKPLQVTNSLFTALKQLRHADQPRILWADAICINQQDVPEKIAQVRLMSRIYSQPTRILIWLGDDTEGLDGLEESIAEALRLLPPEEYDVNQVRIGSQKAFREASDLRKMRKPNIYEHAWLPINRLLCRPWFERKWIIQEVVMAKGTVPRTMVCGDIQLPWDDLASVAYRLGSYGLLSSLCGLLVLSAFIPNVASFHLEQQKPMNAYCRAWTIKVINRYLDECNLTLVDCIMATMMFKCTDPRDHVYALLGLCGAGAEITPNYDPSVSVDDVSKLVAIKTLVGDQNLKALGLAIHTPNVSDHGPTQRSGRPSWVLDLTTLETAQPLVTYSIGPQCFHAGGSSVPLVTTSENETLLHLKGRMVDSVKVPARSLADIPMPTAEDIKPKVGFAVITMWKRNWLQECRNVAAEGNWANMSQGQKRAFAETIICGMVAIREPAPDEVLDGFDVYMDYLFQFFERDYKLTGDVRDVLLAQGGLIEGSIMLMSGQFRFCTTEGGRFGQVRPWAQEGDLFCVILGAEIPYLLRPTGRGTYTLVGDCFLQGMMQGEALTDDSYETVDIVLE